MIARVNPDGTWTVMTLEAAVAYVAENPYAPMIVTDPDERAAWTEQVEKPRAIHGVRPATADEVAVLDAWKQLKARKAAAKERGWTFATLDRPPGASHIVTFGGDPGLASEMAAMSILHHAERGQHELIDFSLPRLLDQVDAHDRG
jgi:hypothetical protein